MFPRSAVSVVQLMVDHLVRTPSSFFLCLNGGVSARSASYSMGLAMARTVSKHDHVNAGNIMMISR